MSKVINLESANYVRIATVDGEQVMLYARPVKVEDFPKSQIYALTASRGGVKGQKEYFVKYEEYIANKPSRATREDNILAQVASGKSAEEIVQEMVARAQARQAKKLAKA